LPLRRSCQSALPFAFFAVTTAEDLLLLYQLLLPLQVFAVILSAAKDPEEANSPQPLEPFSPSLFRRCRCVTLANRLCLLLFCCHEGGGPAFALSLAFALSVAFAVASFCRHPERSEGPRRSKFTTTA
jgi:hypothetical protein